MRKLLRYFWRTAFVVALSFCTSGVFASVYLNETFDEVANGIPEGWSSSGDISQDMRFAAYQNGYSGRCLRFTSSEYALGTTGSSAGKSEILMSPSVSVSGNVTISFWYRNQNAGEFAAYVSRDNGATYENNVLLSPTTEGSNWTYGEYAVMCSPGDQVRVVFEATSNGSSNTSGGAYIYLDEVKIEDVPTCAKPVGLTIYEARPTEATFMWSILANAGTAPSEYQLELWKDGLKVRTETATDNIYTMSSLTPGTTYTLLVKGDCNYAYQLTSPSASITFTTPCSAVTLPYIEDFNDQRSGLLPCWTVGGTHASLPALQTTYKNGDSGAAMRVLSTQDYNAYAVSPTLHATQLENLVVTFTAFALEHSQDVEVGIMTNPYDFSTYAPIGTVDLTANEWNEYSFSSAVLADYGFTGENDFYVVFNAEAGKDREYYIDDLSVAVPDACPRPTDFKVTGVTSSSITVSWTETATPNSRSLSYEVEGEEGEATVVTVTQNPFTLTGLQPSTTYKLFLTLSCAEGESLPSSTLTVSTPCEPTELGEAYVPAISNSLPECWTAVLSSVDRSSGATYPNASGSKINMQKDNLLAVCGFGEPAKNLRLFFTGTYTPLSSSTSTIMTLEVGIMSDINNPDSFEPVHVLTLEASKSTGSGMSTVPTDFELLMSAPPVDGEYIAFRSSDACTISNVKIDRIPECISPVNLRMVEYGTNYVEYAWDARGGVTSYKVKINGEDKGTVNATSYRMEGLTPGTAYSHAVEIIAMCNNEEGESREGSFSFTTYCDPQTITTENPYEVSISGVVYPDCWEVLNENPVDIYSGSYFLHSESGVQMIALPGFTNSLGDLRLTLTIQMPSGYLLVGYVTELGNPDSFVEVQRIEGGFWDNTTYTIAYPACPEGSYMALAADDESEATAQITVVEVKVDLKPNCTSSVKITNHEATTTTIGVTLGSTQGETSWDVVIVPSGQPVSSGTVQTITTTTPSFTGLTSGMTYDIYVRPNCGEGSISDWADPYTASTLCETKSLPYLMDFSTGMLGCYTTSGDIQWEVNDTWGSMAANLSSMTANRTAVLVSEAVNVPEDGTVATLFFDMYRGESMVATDDWGSTTANTNYMRVWVNTTPSLDNATLLRTINNSHQASPAVVEPGMYTYNVNLPIGGVVYVIFEQVMNNSDVGLGECLVENPWWGCEEYAPAQVATIDNIRIEEATGCFTPFVTNVQPSVTSAEIYAKGSSTATQYKFTIGEETRTSETNTIVWDGLTADTEYAVTVSTVCGEEESEVSSSYTFRTRCSALAEANYSDGFEDGLTQLQCWTSTGTLQTVSTAYEGSAALKLDSACTYLLPEMEIEDITTLELSFMAYGMNLTNQMTIGVATDANDIVGTFSSANTVVVKDKNMWREIVVTFENVDEARKGANFIAINMPAGQNVLIDNIRVREKPACPKVTNMNVVVYGDELEVTWESLAQQTEFLLTRNGEKVQSVIVDNDAESDTQSTTLSWVEQNTAGYVLKARSVCGSDSSEWTVDYTFRTPCNRVETLPYTQNFENLGLIEESFTVFPDCWTKVVMNEWSGTGNMLPGLSYNDGNTIGKVALWMWDECVVALPEMKEPIGNLTLTFKVYCAGQEGEELEVGVLESLDQPDAFVLVRSIPKVAGEFMEFEVNFTGYSGRYIALRTHDGDDYRLDDFKVSLTPNCLRPTGVTVTSVAETTANLSIVDPSDNTSWEVVMVPTGVDVSEGTVQAFPSRTGEYTGLQGSKIYDIYVRGCKGDDKSEWMVQLAACRTDCASGSITLPFTESFEDVQMTNLESMYISECWTLKQIVQGEQGTGTDYGDEAWSLGTAHVHGGTVAATLLKGRNGARTLLISPKLNVPEANVYEVVFWIYRQAGTTKDLEGVRVWTNYQQDTLGGQMLAYIPHYGGVQNEDAVNTVSEEGWYEYSVVIPQADNALYVIFEGISQGGADIYMDDIEIRAIPSCRKPERVLVEETAPTSVTITIDDPIGTSWDVAVMKRDSLMEDGFQPVVMPTVTEKTATISGLQTATDYDLYVRTNCGDETSEWTSLLQFSTTCVATTVTADAPYSDNFDAYEAGEMPSCWSSPMYNNLGLVVYPMVERGPMSYYYWDSRTCLTLNNCIAVLPEFTNNVRELVISFDYAGYGIIELGVMTDPLDMNTFVPLYELDAEANTTVQFRAEAEVEKLNFLQYEGTEAHYIAFRVQESNSLLIDDVVVALYSNCEAPQSVVVKDITSESATIEIADTRTSFDYAVVEAGKSVTVEDIVAATESSLTYALSGLSGSTTYDVYVRAYCDGQPGYWSDPVSFTTLCGVETVTEDDPYVVFETLTETDNCYTVLSGSLRNYGANYGNYVTASTVLLLPEFTNSLSDLEIYVETGSSANFKMEAGFLTDPSDASTFVVGGDLVLADRNSSGTVSVGTLQATSNMAVRIVGADSYNMGRYSSAYVKKIQVQMKPGFFLPKNLSVSDLTHNSATVTAEIGRETTECKWLVNDVEQVNTTTDGVLQLTGLTEQTEYTVKVQATDGSGTWTGWSEPLVFVTACAPKALPYTEGFSGEELTACWESSEDVSQAADTITMPEGSYIIVPQVDADLNATQIEVRYESGNAQLTIGTIAGSIDSFEPLQNLDAASNEALVSLQNAPEGHTNIVLMATSGMVKVDEVTVASLGDACFAPTNITLESFSNTSANFTWKAGKDETAWNVTCTVNGVAGEPELVEETPAYELTGLTPGTEQEVKISITSACDESTASAVSEASFSFTTECDLLTITEDASYVADFSAGMPECWADVVPGTNITGGNLSMTGNGEAYIVALPGFTNDLSGLTVMLTAGPGGSENESLDLGYITNVSDPTSFITIQTLDLGAMESTVKSFELALTDVEASGRLALRSNPNYRLYVYALEVAITPSVERPDARVVATTNSFEVTVTAGQEATAAEVIVVESGADRSTGEVQNVTLQGGVGSIVVNGLEQSVAYDIYVRVSAPSKSLWLELTKSTLCYEGALPYSENFDSFMSGVSTDYDASYNPYPVAPSNPSYPDCWTFLNADDYGQKLVFLADIDGESYDGVSLYFDQAWMGDIYAVLPAVGIEAKDLRLSLQYRMWGENGTMSIGVMSDPNDADTFVEIAKMVNQQTYTEASVSFENAPEGYDYIAIKHPNRGNGRLWIDDVRISCVQNPETVTATICSGEEYVHAGIVIPSEQLVPGLNEFDYVVSSTTDGCDKQYHFQITVNEAAETIMISDVVCLNDEPYVNDEYDFTIADPKTMKYYLELPAEDGDCPQLVCLDLTVENPMSIHTVTICDTELPYEFEVNGETEEITEAGVYQFLVPLASGCDSIVRLDLTVNSNVKDVYRTICEGDSVLFNGKQYYTAGDYTAELGTVGECGPETEILHLTVLPLEISIDTTICPNGRPSDGIQFGTTFITEPGDYTRQYFNSLGCEVTEYLHVGYEILNKIQPETVEVCYGEYYDGYQHTDGLFYGTIESVTKDTMIATIIGATNDYCGDSLYLSVRPIIIPETTRDTVVMEDELPFQFGGVTVSGAGTFTGVFESVQGCDSIVHLNVQIQTGLQMVHAGDLILKPNPVQRNHEITVDYQFTAQEREGMRIEVTNSLGQIISIQTQIAEQVTVNPIPVPSFYTVRIVTGDNKYYTAKVLVK